ncbi:MAG: hypothetical protein IJ086_09945 [Clostridium sp.]|nr:hypothetical protein [Clostridium sp.]
MNNLTINQAMSKRAELKKLYDIKLSNVKSVSYNTIIKNKELTGEEFMSHEIQDFDSEFKSMISLSDEIDALSNAISKANSIAKVDIEGKDLTIQECLNKLAAYRSRVSTIRTILERSKESEERRVDASGTSPYYKITKANYNVAEMKELLESLNNDIMTMELAVDKANNDTVINVG